MMPAMNRRRYLSRSTAGLILLLSFALFPADVLAQSDLGSPQRIRHVESALVIKKSQAGPWSDYVAALKAYRAAVRDVREAEIELLGGAQAIDGDNNAVLNERQGARLLAKDALKASYETLYEALDPAQQQIADATLTVGECGR